MVDIFDPACELLPPWTKELYLCSVAPLLYLLSDLLPPSPLLKLNVQYIQTVCGWEGGGGVMNCTVDHILQEFYTLFLTRFRTYKIATPPQTKMTSKDDIKGLVSLKFFRPWWELTAPVPFYRDSSARSSFAMYDNKCGFWIVFWKLTDMDYN